MASSNTKRTRSERVASLQLEPSSLRRWTAALFSGRFLLQIGIAIVAAVLIILVLQGWRPPFAFREGQIPLRDIMARVDFTMEDQAQTEAARARKRRMTLCRYENNPESIWRLKADLRRQLDALDNERTYAELSDEQRNALESFLGSFDEAQISAAEGLARIRGLLQQHGNLEGGKLDGAIQAVLDPIIETGLLTELEHSEEQGDTKSIVVLPDEVRVEVSKVWRSEIIDSLPQRLTEEFQQVFNDPDAVIAARLIANYLVDRMPESSLTYAAELSAEERRKAEESVDEVVVAFFGGVSQLAAAGKPIERLDELATLRAEYEAWLELLSWGETAIHLAAFTGMVAAFYLLCGLFIHFQHDQRLLTDTVQLTRLLGTVVVTCFVCAYTSSDPMRAEIVGLVICALSLTIAFGRQVALLVSNCLALTITLGLGLDIGEFVTLCSGVCTVTLLLGRIRTRTKLIYVGLATAAVVTLTHLGVDVVMGKLHAVYQGADVEDSLVTNWVALLPVMVVESLRLGGFTLLAAALMTGLLPFAERMFGIQTDLSLLEMGDASHPLLRQLAQRAPGTYNHSINVAAIAEAAADRIGAHGLLTRVGAYFHDIGKMFKPNYFIENQDQGSNRHDTLQPAMSTLVIIAHVKDGADLARQHRLPKRIIDFIEQHHGTTLVEYFYREAEKRSQIDPSRGEVSETSFRYPGPKPQSLESAVLMLADSVESASRTLVEPTPSRIQSLVDQIAMKKLLDGQFDECGLTLQQLEQVKKSLVKSLTAIYHGRVKYSGQATA